MVSIGLAGLLGLRVVIVRRGEREAQQGGCGDTGRTRVILCLHFHTTLNAASRCKLRAGWVRAPVMRAHPEVPAPRDWRKHPGRWTRGASNGDAVRALNLKDVQREHELPALQARGLDRERRLQDKGIVDDGQTEIDLRRLVVEVKRTDAQPRPRARSSFTASLTQSSDTSRARSHGNTDACRPAPAADSTAQGPSAARFAHRPVSDSINASPAPIVMPANLSHASESSP